MSAPQSPPPPPPPSNTAPDVSLTMESDEANEDDAVGWLLMEQCWSECGEQFEGCAVRFIQNPYSSLLVFQSSSDYITINGNEESCGSSFSDCGTSFMATLHSTTPSFHHHDASHSSNFNADPDNEDDENELLSTFLGLPDHQHQDNDDPLPTNYQQQPQLYL